MVREDGGEATQMVDLADNAWHACTFNRGSVGVEMGGFATRGFEAPLVANTARMFAYLCYHFQIPVCHARAGVGPGIASHSDWALLAAAITIHPTTLSSWKNLLTWSMASIVRAIFPDVWNPPQAPEAVPAFALTAIRHRRLRSR